MILYPAIDILDGRAVRLLQGDYERETVYDDDPVVAARRWVDAGAAWLHVVDLDGARAGEPVNLDHVAQIVAAVDIPVQFGGGLRDSKQVEEAISAGSSAWCSAPRPSATPRWPRRSPPRTASRVVAAVDARGARSRPRAGPSPEGIGQPRHRRPARRARDRALHLHPVDVDGTMEGPDLDSLREVAEATGAELIYSGGVGSLEDLRALAALELDNLGA